jgi:hypothetical protein
MIYQEIEGRRYYIDEYYAGDVQVVTRYTLNDLKYEANYLIPMDEQDNQPLWAVTDVYRFYCLNNNILRQDKYEMFYLPKNKCSDDLCLKSIKMFIEKKSGFRTDWYCSMSKSLTYRTYETGNEFDADYKKYEWTEQNLEFRSNTGVYYGEYSDTNLIDDLLVNIKKINYNQTLSFYQKSKKYYNKVIKLKALPF